MRAFGVTDEQLRKWVATVGVPSAIAFWLVYVMTTQLSGAISAHAMRTTQENESAVKLLRLICVGVAQDAVTKVECNR